LAKKLSEVQILRQLESSTKLIVLGSSVWWLTWRLRHCRTSNNNTILGEKCIGRSVVDCVVL